MWDIIMFLKKEGKGGGSRWWLIIKREYNFQATFHTGGSATTTLITPISVCYYSKLRNATTIPRECNILSSKVILS